MHRGGAVALAFVVALVASPAAAGLFVGEAAASANGATPHQPASERGPVVHQATGPAPTGPAAERTNLSMVLEVQTNGDVRWTVTSYVDLATENDTRAFRDQAQRWRNGNLDVGYDADLFRTFARASTNATGRMMRIPQSSVERTAGLVDNGSRGAFRLSFTWTNFARRDDEELVIDDAFQTESGAWLTGLKSGQMLVIRPPEEFTFESHPGGARLQNRSLIWEGPTSFSESYFTRQPIVFVAGNTPPSPTPTRPPGSQSPPPSSPGTTVPPPGQGTQDGLMLGIVAALLLGGGLAAYRRYGGEYGPAGTPFGADGGDGDGGVATESADGGTETESAPEPAAEASPDPEPTPDDPFAGVDPDLLSDEEQVLRLLEANGGRMKQATIVTETGWSNAKVSQLLSAMDDDEEIDKLRIGRENLISLPDVEVGEVE